MSGVKEVEDVILAVYGCAGDENRRREALAWLHTFQETAQAWNISIQLLLSTSKVVQFFASNLLYKKVQKGWRDQTDDVKREVQNQIVEAVRNYVEDDNNGFSEKTVQRLCLILARITVYTPLELDGFVAQAVSFLQRGLDPTVRDSIRNRALFICTELLIVLPEEIKEDAPSNHSLVAGLDPEGIDAQIVKMVPNVVQVITQLLNQPSPTYHARGLDCLSRWAPVAIDMCNLVRYQLLNPILLCLYSCTDADVIEAASNAMIAVVEKKSYENINSQPESEETIAAFDRTVEGLLACRTRLANQNPEDNDNQDSVRIALCICKLVVAVGESQIERIVTGATSQLLSLVDMMMAFTGHHSRNVAIRTLNFWLLIQDAPLLERPEQLRQPCFRVLLETLLRQCQLDHDAHTGCESDIEYDIQSFRSSGDGSKEPFQVISYVLGTEFLQSILNLLRTTSDWQVFESSLFALSAASSSIVEQVLTPGPQAAHFREVIGSILTELPKMQLLVTNGATLKSGVTVFGDYSKVLCRLNRTIIETSLQFALVALTFSEEVGFEAGKAFGKICTACRMEMAMYPQGVQGLAEEFEKANEKYPSSANGNAQNGKLIPLMARIEVAQGIARVASCMQQKPCTETLVALLTPSLNRLRSSVDTTDAETIINELQVLRAVVRLMHVCPGIDKEGAQHPVAEILYETLPILSSITGIPALKNDPQLIDALYGLISQSFLSAHVVLSAHLEGLLQGAIQQFKSTWSPCCIQCIGKAVEIFATKPGMEPGFVSLFSMLMEAMVQAVREKHVISNPQIITEFYDTAFLFMLFCPTAVYSGTSETGDSMVDVILQLSAECASGEESSSIRVLLTFISSFIGKPNRNANDKFTQYKRFLDEGISKRGEYLVHKLLIALVTTVPPEQKTKLCHILAKLAWSYTNLVQVAVYNTLVNAPQPFSALTDQSKEAFVAIIPQIANKETQAKSTFIEFCNACRKQIQPSEFQNKLVDITRIAQQGNSSFIDLS